MERVIQKNLVKDLGLNLELIKRWSGDPDTGNSRTQVAR